jgi:hypothetical protein
MPWVGVTVAGTPQEDSIAWIGSQASSVVWTNMPAAAGTEFQGTTQRRKIKDLTGRTEARMSSGHAVTGASGARLTVEYSVNSGSSWAALGCSVLIDTANDTTFGAWAAIPAAARTPNTWLRLSGDTGDGVADPSFSDITAYFR